jgi:hypothetical protein
MNLPNAKGNVTGAFGRVLTRFSHQVQFGHFRWSRTFFWTHLDPFRVLRIKFSSDISIGPEHSFQRTCLDAFFVRPW